MIANKFSAVFANTCRPSAPQAINSVTEEALFKERLANYKGDPVCVDHFLIIEFIGMIINEFENGKAAGYDLLTAEYLKYSHPIVISCIHKLFIFILNCNYVPDAFGIGITIPLLKSDCQGSAACSASYRGITILPVISKLLELILLKILTPYLTTCNSQFGFKKGISCSHVVYSLRKTVEYFNNLDSTVNVCALDISKAFDTENHVKLFNKMMDKNVPLCCILLLKCWFDKSSICVRWGDSFSYFVDLKAGVRQGSSLSPKLFVFYGRTS